MTLTKSATFTTIVNNCTAAAVETLPVFEADGKDLDRTYRLVVAHEYLKMRISPMIINASKICGAGGIMDAIKICQDFEMPISLAKIISTANQMDGWCVEAPTSCAFFEVLLSYVEVAIDNTKVPLPLDFGETFDPSSRMLAAAAVMFLQDRLWQILAESRRLVDQEDIDAALRLSDDLGQRMSIDQVLLYAGRYAGDSKLR